ncbi:elongation factor P maturation arginine rhamnosyltransferase EarP [Massilia sp. CFBP9012]|uniref:elongation factor P maturation arginine rhamnosyltransferase EarP n=1 Tax=Massilia sp. CFBP9012 TaxID=3096531 RepID=UPI002A6B58A0|nr:elongation factor P maturation arginine rhamnosyltransferase EarP [Massilia sp. CFBP9012]MDY0976649.1 elongation factor P maturation arginine rhamnosyltransferase EarP [Massilia sp. CFBP9012]
MFQNSSAPSLAIFCKVVDNYGDIGICWRLARQLRHEHGVAVTLWVDDLASFRRICPEVDPGAAAQAVQGVAVRHWRGQDDVYGVEDIPDVVIEFFGCELPPSWIEAMAARTPRPVWINYEGLTAEEWVEGCHRLPSMHPRLKLTKHFYFPGFNERTGGLLREAGLDARRRAFQQDPAQAAAFLARFGVAPEEAARRKVSLFCYPEAPVDALFGTWREAAQPTLCLVPEGVARERVEAFLGGAAAASASATRGALTLKVLPFVPQEDYDLLLWSCDLNFVRGEDSWVRAQWAGRPFVWHIYPQDEQLHHKKLRAFLQAYAKGLPALDAFMLGWNGARTIGDWAAAWTALEAELPRIAEQAEAWHEQVTGHGDLATKLLDFVCELGQAQEKRV